MPHEWFDAIADWEEEVNEIAYKMFAARQEAAFMAGQRR